jgi:serine/threonine protein phosphatase PrpC
LCTDGVLHCITDEDLVKLLESSDVDEKKSNIMANRCKDSSDNNTAWLVRIESIEESEHCENEDIIIESNETVTDTVPSKKSAMSMTEIESVKRGKKSLIAKIRSIFN